MSENKKILWFIFFAASGAILFLGGFSFTRSKIIEINPLPAQISSSMTRQETTADNHSSAVLILTGDIMLNRRVELMMRTKNDYTFPFLNVNEDLRKADLVFGNLEGPLSDQGEKVGSIYSFRANPEAIKGLQFAGFDILSLANNHSFDYGKEALEDTFTRLKAADIDYIGAGKNESEAYGELIKEINGVKIAFLAYTNLGPESWQATSQGSGLAWVGAKNLPKIKRDIQKAKAQADILIVSLHAGEEYIASPSQFQIDFARSAIEEGADLVVGHHPHVVQKNEIYPSTGSGQVGWIFYSLGNFVFDQSFSENTMKGQLVKVLIEDKKIKEVIPINVKINNFFQPELEQ